MGVEQSSTLYCDFCGKARHEVDVLIRGPLVAICDECIQLAQQRVDERRSERAAPTTGTERGEGCEREQDG